jgi:aspartate-semialdehyde dehydrogenase
MEPMHRTTTLADPTLEKRVAGAPWGWDDAHRAAEVAVIGATGAVGHELLELLVAARHPRERIHASARKPGSIELVLSRAASHAVHIDVKPFDAASTEHLDIAFLCTPSEVSRELAPRLAERGVRVIDLSSALRMRADIPLVVPEINAHELGARELANGPRIVANPNCTTAIAALPLAIVERELGLEEVVVVSYQAASGAGRPGLETLAFELARECGVASPSSAPHASPFPATLCNNVIPAVAELLPTGESGEERKIADELRKILGLASLSVEATTARVPVERCHSVAVHVKTRRPLELAKLVASLRAAPGIAVTDDEHGPRPRECAGTDAVHVGRIRAGGRGPCSLCFFAVGDQLRKGAALNAFQVAGHLSLRR